MTDVPFDWRAALGEIHPDAARLAGRIERFAAGELALPRRQRELILMACAAAQGRGGAVREHGLEAMYYGATDAEIVEALALAALGGGVAALGCSLAALGDQLTLKGEERS